MASYPHAVAFPLKFRFYASMFSSGLRAVSGLQPIPLGVYHAPVILLLWHIITVFYLLLATAHTDN